MNSIKNSILINGLSVADYQVTDDSNMYSNYKKSKKRYKMAKAILADTKKLMKGKNQNDI